MFENMIQPEKGTDDTILRRMRIAYWITKATNAHSEFVIFIDFITATVVTRTPSHIPFVCRLPVLLTLSNFDRQLSAGEHFLCTKQINLSALFWGEN